MTTTTLKKYRYPGSKPFTTEQKDIFFGREQDIDRIYEMVMLEPSTVLFSKSGLGKSSLINAGLLPRITDNTRIRTITIRLGAYQSSSSVTPSATTVGYISGPQPFNDTLLDRIIPDEPSIWTCLKERQLTIAGDNEFLLIFDQFEELFTYPETQILAFKQQLAEAFNTTIPQRFRKRLELLVKEDPNFISDEEMEQLNNGFDLKLMFAIRSDRLHLLNQIQDYFPDLLTKCYELKALTPSQAEDAIFNPAYKKDDSFISPPFDYTDDAVESMLEYLTEGGKHNIESFQLQILCQVIERKVIQNNLSIVSMEEIGDIESIYKNYYYNQITSISDKKDRLSARKLIEEGLIFEEEQRRLSLYEGQIEKQFNVSPDLLRNLVDCHLLRAEPSQMGGFTYELSHDSLVGPVLKAKAIRVKQEEKEQEEEDKKKEIATMKKRRNRKRLYIAATLLCIFGVMASGLTFWAFSEKSKAEDLAEGAVNDKLDFQIKTGIILDRIGEKINTSGGDTFLLTLFQEVESIVIEKEPGDTSTQLKSAGQIQIRERLIQELFNKDEKISAAAKGVLIKEYQNDPQLVPNLLDIATQNINSGKNHGFVHALIVLDSINLSTYQPDERMERFLTELNSNQSLRNNTEIQKNVVLVRNKIERIKLIEQLFDESPTFRKGARARLKQNFKEDLKLANDFFTYASDKITLEHKDALKEILTTFVELRFILNANRNKMQTFTDAIRRNPDFGNDPEFKQRIEQVYERIGYQDNLFRGLFSTSEDRRKEVIVELLRNYKDDPYMIPYILNKAMPKINEENTVSIWYIIDMLNRMEEELDMHQKIIKEFLQKAKAVPSIAGPKTMRDINSIEERLK